MDSVVLRPVTYEFLWPLSPGREIEWRIPQPDGFETIVTFLISQSYVEGMLPTTFSSRNTWVVVDCLS